MKTQMARACCSSPRSILLISLVAVAVLMVIHSPVDILPKIQNKSVVAESFRRDSIPISVNRSDVAHNFRRPNQVITEYDEDVARRLKMLVQRRATASDAELIRLITDMLDPPSQRRVKMSRQLFSTPQSREVDTILNKKRGGFYVECGAFDGERSSNTLYLERERGWTGLLVEMDPYFYTQLIGKSRRSWSINACLSPQPYVTQLAYKESSGGAGELLISGSGNTKNTKLVPCFPVEALLVALNRTKVDYFSLDVEGFELDILRTIPFHEIDVSVLSVEYVHGRSGKQSYANFMKQQGYDVHKDIHFHDQPQTIFVDDFIFVKSAKASQ